MKDIRLVIRISEKDFQHIKFNYATDNSLCPVSQKVLIDKIANGVPIPENSIFVEKRVGKWVWKPTGYSLIDGTIGDWNCSVCNNAIDKNVPMNCIGHVLPYNFCPICGAKTERLDFGLESLKKGDSDD